jgi:phospholipid N-methyltransferase
MNVQCSSRDALEKEGQETMKILKKMASQVILGATVSILAAMVSPVHALEFDPETLKTVDELILKMQQETMQQQYESMPLRRELPGKMMNNMYNYASNAYRQNIQPQMVQAVVSNMRPWDFPNKFKQAMMPSVVKQMSSQIKQIQVQYMQQGINDPSFPNVIQGPTTEQMQQ